MVWALSSHPYKNVPEWISFVFLVGLLVVRNIDVGTIGVTIVAGTMVAFDVAIDTGINVDVARNDAFTFEFDEFGDNVLYGYIWRFSVCVPFVGIKMWCVWGPDGTRDGGGDGDGDDWNGNLVPLFTKVQNQIWF